MQNRKSEFTTKQVKKHLEVTMPKYSEVTENSTVHPVKIILLLAAFIITGIAAVFIGQVMAGALGAVGIHHSITVWLVPAAPIAVVAFFLSISKRIGIKI